MTVPADRHQDIENLRSLVAALSEAIDAATESSIDAVIAGTPGNERIYTLVSAERPYRLIVENMGEGALTVSEHQTILYVNRCMVEMLGKEASDLTGRSADELVVASDRLRLAELLQVEAGESAHAEVELAAASGPPPRASLVGLL